ncbi:MAG: ribosomal protein L7/L12 [Gemmataceae bacterium]
MTEDEPFIAGIRANPLDDLRRLVYADWLDERGRAEEAEYLRLVAALAAAGAAVDPGHLNTMLLLALAQRLDPQWREAVGGRFDLWLDGYEAEQKINFIKLIRQTWGIGLAEAKTFSEALPKSFCTGVPLEEARGLADWFARVSTVSRVVPSTTNTRTDGPRSRVSLVWDMGWFPEEWGNLDPASALSHLRRLLTRDTEFVPLAATVPETWDTERASFAVPLIEDLSYPEAARRTKQLAIRLIGSEGVLDGEAADPPFPGIITVTSDGGYDLPQGKWTRS